MPDALVTVTIPWPDRKLSPNARGSWHGKAPVTKTAREWACYQVLNETVFRVAEPGRLGANITFYPPDRKRYDLDNCIAKVKASIDGVFDGLGLNDRLLDEIHAYRGFVIEEGMVSINIFKLEGSKHE